MYIIIKQFERTKTKPISPINKMLKEQKHLLKEKYFQFDSEAKLNYRDGVRSQIRSVFSFDSMNRRVE
jgi:hypothetical protein